MKRWRLRILRGPLPLRAGQEGRAVVHGYQVGVVARTIGGAVMDDLNEVELHPDVILHALWMLADFPEHWDFTTTNNTIDSDDPNLPERYWTWEIIAGEEVVLDGHALDDPTDTVRFIVAVVNALPRLINAEAVIDAEAERA